MALRLISRRLHPLSRRQYEVLTMFGEGMTYREIAEKTGLAYHTVKRHMEEARKKMGCKSAGLAVLKLKKMVARNA